MLMILLQTINLRNVYLQRCSNDNIVWDLSLSIISNDESRNSLSTHFLIIYDLRVKSIGSISGTGLLLRNCIYQYILIIIYFNPNC